MYRATGPSPGAKAVDAAARGPQCRGKRESRAMRAVGDKRGGGAKRGGTMEPRKKGSRIDPSRAGRRDRNGPSGGEGEGPGRQTGEGDSGGEKSGEGDRRGRQTGGRKTGSDGTRGSDGSGRRPGRGKQRVGRRRRNDRGQYVETVTETEILDLLDRIPGPVLTTSDLAETFDITTEGARRKLNDLCEAGVLDRRKSGQTRVYWRVGTEQVD